MSGLISLVIPVLNEEKRLAETLAALPGGLEVIVVDGGSTDSSREIVRQYGAALVLSGPGRGRQMNLGAQQAKGDILLFLHADTILPDGFQQEIAACLGKQGAVAGAFRLHLTGNKGGLRLISWGANMRSRIFQLPYGDQALFMRQETFHELGGFPEQPLMEDFMLVRALRKKGKVVLAEKYVRSSGRKWSRKGLIRTTLINQIIVLGFIFGLSADFLAKIYGVRK